MFTVFPRNYLNGKNFVEIETKNNRKVSKMLEKFKLAKNKFIMDKPLD